jgi:DNA helicase II / ATP-dependent DNA helicase PcrA
MSKPKFELCDTRKAIISQDGHLLVLGGPGSGKTTIALLKAKELCKRLAPGQEILFLSFSRAAVRQILGRCKDVLTRNERALLTVKTYHSFCIETLESYGRVLAGKQPRFVFPREESIRRADHDGEWRDEVSRLAQAGTFCFDAVAGGVADVFERSSLVRNLYAKKFPTVIVDEFQDTDESQWRVVMGLANATTVFCLADADQRIFEYRNDIDPKRIEKARAALSPMVFDLGVDNHRSPNAGILDFADAVLKNTKLPETGDVRYSSYYPNNFGHTVHLEVVRMFGLLRQRRVEEPTVAVLSRSNTLVSQISFLLSQPHDVTNHGKAVPLKPIEHSVVWDAELTIAAAGAVASILEWPIRFSMEGVSRTLRAVARFHRQKNAQRSSRTALDAFTRFEKAAKAVSEGKRPATNAAKALVEARAPGVVFLGDPTQDWMSARNVLATTPGFEDVFAEARMMRLFHARDEVGGSLAALWLATGGYAGAERTVELALDRQVLMSADREPSGCVLMSIHKSKGKEFDGVILVEGTHSSPFFDARDRPPHAASRRLLRVGITRARALVRLVRPHSAMPLVDVRT